MHSARHAASCSGFPPVARHPIEGCWSVSINFIARMLLKRPLTQALLVRESVASRRVRGTTATVFLNSP